MKHSEEITISENCKSLFGWFYKKKDKRKRYHGYFTDQATRGRKSGKQLSVTSDTPCVHCLGDIAEMICWLSAQEGILSRKSSINLMMSVPRELE